MDFGPEFLASSSGKEFVAGGVGGMAGVLAGHPLDTLRIRQQHSTNGTAFGILRNVVAREGPCALYRGMLAPLASVSFQTAITFQSYATLSQAFDPNTKAGDPPSYKAVVLGGIGAGALQSLLISPVELVKIRLQLQRKTNEKMNQSGSNRGPLDVARSILKAEGWRGICRGLRITMLRDSPSHGLYFWTYEYTKEQLQPGCRKNGQETFRTMLLAGGLAGVTSWIFCYPLDVLKTRIQAQSHCLQSRYCGIVDCYRKCVTREGYNVLWRGLGTAVARAFVVNGVVFTAYETALRCIHNSKNRAAIQTENTANGGASNG
ncbi:UNVERIFIED_CONTAM: Mitochondrial arginine transporter BAC2 [Sesamum radiatum]|uniref:Mitochondrial arginine transporter BAC2 n=1 Tax=Sesamum radiatum TaxID=300843 RepID=A0AAW2PIK6_SESRA